MGLTLLYLRKYSNSSSLYLFSPSLPLSLSGTLFSKPRVDGLSKGRRLQNDVGLEKDKSTSLRSGYNDYHTQLPLRCQRLRIELQGNMVTSRRYIALAPMTSYLRRLWQNASRSHERDVPDSNQRFTTWKKVPESGARSVGMSQTPSTCLRHPSEGTGRRRSVYSED